MSQLQLMKVLQFTTDDLRTNREGRITEAQRERFTPPKPNQVVVMVVFGHLIAVAGLFALLAIVTKSTALWVVMGVVVLMFFAPFGIIQQKNQLRPIMQDDIAKGIAEEARGTAILTPVEARKPYYELLIGGVTIKLSIKEAEGFINGDQYCIYYLPGSKTLLSVEHLD